MWWRSSGLRAPAGWGRYVLDDRRVTEIDGALTEERDLATPLKLKELKGQFSQGQDTMGRGFELTKEEREALLRADPTSNEVIFPLFHGQDLNTMPTPSPYRWVIYFRDWPEERARKYRAAFRRVEDLVKPYRDGLTGQIHQDCFWKFWDLRPGLMREFGAKSHVLAIAWVTKHLCVSRVSTHAVYNKEVKVLFFDGFGELAVSAKLAARFGPVALWDPRRVDPRYSTTAVLETWPMPN